MSLLVDTSVWSLALRRDTPPDGVEVRALRSALEQGESVVCTGLILQELLQGLAGAKSTIQTQRTPCSTSRPQTSISPAHESMTLYASGRSP